MNKLWLIIKREYLSRVKKKTFILVTLLTPLGFGLLFVISGLLATYEGDDTRTIAIVDPSNILNKSIADSKNIYFKFEDKSVDELKDNFEESGYDGIVLVPTVQNVNTVDFTSYYYSNDKLSPNLQLSLSRKMRDAIRDYKVKELGLDQSQLDALDTDVSIDPEPIEEGAKDESAMSSAIAMGIGGFMCFFMYMVVFIYGSMVMRSVMEEKTTRIVEVMISSVKPFQLMLGKLIGVGGVGLTQLLIWAVLLPTISIIAASFLGVDPDQQAEALQNSGVDVDETMASVNQIFEEIFAQNWWLLLPLFIFFFIGGYFLYSSMFAAVGSAIGDDITEGQQLTLPIVIPVILALYISFAVIQNPNSSLAVWSSIFPLFSPIVMPARLALGVPTWQIVLSMVVLVASVVLFVWLAGRIYRVGILLYGKKASFKEIGKWLFSKI